MEKGRILIVDDEEDILHTFQMILEEDGYQVKTTTDAREGLEMLKEEDFDLVLSDMRMPHMSGEEFLRELRKFNRITSFIVMTAYGTIDNAVKCMKEGAFHYITKPVDFNDLSVWKLIEEAVEKAKILRENEKLKHELETGRSEVDFIITRNPTMVGVIDFIKKVAPFDNTILIYGESGVGKELVARAIHSLSPRRDRPFIAVNCANISAELMEAEFFGYKKGAFTGATEDKKGIFEKADGGTVFLDEIGEIPYDIQAKFLRFLESKEIRRIGDEKVVKVDVRIIAATNRDLQKLVNEGRFRDDLYYRIGGFKIEIPPLRERKEDIPLLVNHFIEKYSKKYGKNILGIKPEALSLLIRYDFPGNVRQLESVISKAVILAENDSFIGKEHIDQEVQINVREFPLEYGKAKKIYTEKFMKKYLGILLSITNGNISQAAKIAKIERQSLQKLIKKYGIDPSIYKK
ncbi:MAG: sigma-54-dependent Fis family transcriptional regulator [Aquificae bacterium]|nr:sigma-54-dependent Fis family transcriptional regulator [Aquificota bacterium]